LKEEFRDELPKTLIGKHLRRVLVKEEQDKLDAAHQEEETLTSTGSDTSNSSDRPAKKGLQFSLGNRHKHS